MQKAIEETKHMNAEMKRNLEMERISTSQAIDEMKNFIEREQIHDPFINTSLLDSVDNAFREPMCPFLPKSCTT